MTGISTLGVPTQAQPAFSNLSGSATASQMPAFTGDVSTSAGSTATTLATVNTNTGSYGSSTAIPNFTVNAKGLITAAGTNPVVAPISTLSGAGTGVIAALANTVNATNGLVTVNGALGTPTSGTLTNATGLPLSTGIIGTLSIGNGGIGVSTTPANGAIPIGNGSGYTVGTITAGSGISVTNTAGSITIASSGSTSGMTLISTQTASNSASLQWTGLGTTYNSYLLIFRSLVPASSQDLLFLQVGEGGTPTWKTTTYTGSGTYESSTGGGTSVPQAWGQAGSGAASVGVNLTESSSAGSSTWQVEADGEVYIHNMPSTTKFVTVVGDVSFLAGTTLGSSSFQHGTIYGFYQGDNTTAKTAIRLIAASGNIASGTASLYGISN